ncbi:MAG: sortase [bacterium]|nr:sortase [Candidatus Wildermuthbacteria bacterium]MDP2664760.1 sortase [bacterium]
MGHTFPQFTLKHWVILTVFTYGLISLFLFSLSAKSANESALLSAAPSLKGETLYPVDKIVIPALDIVAPITAVSSTDPKDFKLPLKEGVALYPSVKPGDNGGAIILGHSSPPGWPKINYDWVFSTINTLQENDEIIVYFQGKKYVFAVSGSLFLGKGQDIPSWALASRTPTLLLVSCWPPGINNKRIVMLAELKEGI